MDRLGLRLAGPPGGQRSGLGETREQVKWITPEGPARAELILEAVESIAPRLAAIPDPEIPDDDEED